MRPLKTVLIDIDGTLLDSQKRKDQFYSLVINELNKQYGPNTFSLQELLTTRDALFHSYPDGRRNDPKLILKKFLDAYELPIDEFKSTLTKLMDLFWQNLKKSRPIEDASDFLYELTQNGFRYLLYSDGTSEETNFKLNLFPDQFLPPPCRALVSDCRPCSNPNIIPLGRNKNAETYKFLKHQYGAIAMVGDSEAFDITPALQAGLHAFNVKKIPFKRIIKVLLKIKK